MRVKLGRVERAAAILIAATSLVGAVLLYRDHVLGKAGWPVLWSTFDFFSLFTVESNVLVMIVTGALALAERRARPAIAGAVCLYIIVAGVTYYLLLSAVYHPEGPSLVAVVLLHYVVPPAYVLFWLAFIPRGRLAFWHVAAWLVFPVAFVAYTFGRGAIVGWYPYPFLDVATLGYATVISTVAVLVVAFSAVGILIVAIDRWMARLARPAD
jgi:hypothetical protein